MELQRFYCKLEMTFSTQTMINPQSPSLLQHVKYVFRGNCVKIPAGRAKNLALLVSPLNFCCLAVHDEKEVGRIMEGSWAVAHRELNRDAMELVSITPECLHEWTAAFFWTFETMANSLFFPSRNSYFSNYSGDDSGRNLFDLPFLH